MGEHRITGSKQLAYEAAQPALWIAGPGFPKGKTSDAYATNIDIAPTIAKAAGADVRYGDDPPWDGRKLQSVVAEADHGHDRFLPIHVPSVTTRGAGWHPKGDGVRTWRYKYVKYADGSEELYDLHSDPHELTNLAGSGGEYAAIKADMSRLLKEAKACKGANCRNSAPAHLQQ